MSMCQSGRCPSAGLHMLTESCAFDQATPARPVPTQTLQEYEASASKAAPPQPASNAWGSCTPAAKYACTTADPQPEHQHVLRVQHGQFRTCAAVTESER